MNVNVDKMIEEQSKQNIKIANTVAIKDDMETVCYIEKEVITKTNLVGSEDMMLLTRYMYNHIYVVEFAKDVMVKDIIGFMELSDGMFIKCARRQL